MPFQLINIDSSFNREKLLCRDAAINRYYYYYYYYYILLLLLLLLLLL